MHAFVSHLAIFGKLTIKSTQNDVQITSKTRQNRCQNIDHIFITKKWPKRAPKGTQKRARKVTKTAHFWDKTENEVPRGSRESPKRYFREIIGVLVATPPKTPARRVLDSSGMPNWPYSSLQSVSVRHHFRTLRLQCSPPNHIIQRKTLTQT